MTADSKELVRAFENRDLDNRSFGHRDHVAVAFEMLRRYDFIEAVTRFATNIKVLAAKAGAPEKFNATITFAFMSLIAERMKVRTYSNAEDFMVRNPDLLSKGLLDRWYSQGRLRSDLAREVFLLPDGADVPGD